MKKMILVLVAALAVSAGTAYAQNTIVVDTEKVFTSITAYNNALKEIDALSEKHRKEIEEAFDELEKAFNNYQNNRSSLSMAERQQYEQKILDRENEILKFQDEIFGAEGTIMQKRIELITPIQNKVMEAIRNYAESRNIDIVMDVSSNASLLYYNPSKDHTQAIMALVRD